MTPVETTLRRVRVLHLVFLSTVALFFFELRMIIRPAERGVSPVTVAAFAFACCCDIGIGIFFRGRMLTPAIERLRANPQDAAALRRWRAGSIMSFAYAETVVLFGFMLKILGAAWNVAGVFFVVGILLFLVWVPRLDVSPGK